MRDYSKVGGRKGKPGYRTPSVFIAKKVKNIKLKQKRAGNKKEKAR